ncbi:MAG: acyl-CoA synthetase [Gammaproteobacteria bacterium]|nr:acyl-CoA synthetase [Gammaproteobacteria bacterium]
MNLIKQDGRDFDAICRAFRWDIPKRLNIAQLTCDRHAGSDKVAIYYENDKGEIQHASFSRLKELSDRFANALRGLGLQPGDRVAIILPQRIETAVAHLACYKIGAIALPLSILFGRDAVQYRIEDSAAKIAITDAGRLDMMEQIGTETDGLETIIGCGCGNSKHEFWHLLQKSAGQLKVHQTLAEDAALLIYTSGTTGPPKGALIAQRSMLGNLTGFEMSHDFFPQPDDLFWTPADWAWTGGLWDALLPTLYFGKPILAYEGGKFDPERACHLLGKYQVRNAFIPPTALKLMRQVDNIRQRHSVNLRSVMSAGESVGEELLHWGREALGLDINEMWGQTEFNYLVGNCSAIMPPKPGSMGKAYPGHEVEVINGDGQTVPVGEQGELAAKRGDPVMFLGYWNRVEETRRKFRGDWFCTGDLGYRDEDGYLWFVGRTDDVISSAGYRIGPGEIENCLLKHPAILQAAVIGKPDALRGSVVKAFVVLSEGHVASDELCAQIQNSVRTQLAAYEYPREVEFVDSLPMTTTGKIRRIELRQREIEKQNQSAD